MPVYTFKCGKGHIFDEPRTISNRDLVANCPTCQAKAKRDKVASMHPHTDKGYDKEILSDALGIHPDQISDAKAKFPHHNYAPDGRMILRSHQERKQVLKDLGFRDWNSFY